MSNIVPELREILDQFDGRQAGFSEHDVSGGLGAFLIANPGRKEELGQAFRADFIAFKFLAREWIGGCKRGQYFGPMFAFLGKDGKEIEDPCLADVTPEFLDYWKKRSRVAKHPIMKARYADLVWEFSPAVTGKGCEVEFAQRAIDGYTEIVGKGLCHGTWEASRKLKRCLDLALSISDQKRIQETRNAIIGLEDSIAELGRLGKWGFSYDFLVENKAVPLPEDQCRKIIAGLETALVNALGSDDGRTEVDPFAAQRAAMRLRSYYERNNRKEDVRRVLRVYSAAFLKKARTVMPLLGVGWLRTVYNALLDHGMKAEAEEVSVVMRDLAKNAHADFITTTHKAELSKDKVEAYIDSLVEPTLGDSLTRIAHEFLPDLNRLSDRVKNLPKEFPISNLFGNEITSWDGRIVASIAPGDSEGRLVFELAMEFKLWSSFLYMAFERVKSVFNPKADELTDYLYQSPVFDEERKTIVHKGLEAYLENDHLVAVHMLVPMVENSLRKLLEMLGGSTYTRGSEGQTLLRGLNEVLSDKRIKQFLGEEVQRYFVALLVDQRGWNVRNNVCHGIIPAAYCGRATSDRILHVLLLLAQIRRNEPGSPQNAGASQ